MTGQLTTPASQSIASGGGSGTIEVRATGGGDAAMSFHRPGVFACNFGLGSDNNFYFGGWSYGATAYKLWSTRDFGYIPQPNLGFTPVQQAGGAFQAGNKIYIGWDNARLRAQVDGVDLQRFWMDYGTSQSFAGNGYQVFPNGLVFQWGSSVLTADVNGVGYVTFPTAFPTACRLAIVNNGDLNTGPLALMSTGSTSTTQLQVRAMYSYGGIPYGNTTLRFNWMATGQ